jgi:hypothetical protein
MVEVDGLIVRAGVVFKTARTKLVWFYRGDFERLVLGVFLDE